MISMDFKLFLCLIVCFFSPFIASSSSQLCNSPNGEVCCSGYVWNETQHTCTRCMDGFYGRNCTFRCSYPSFGLDCQLKCICSSEECHHAYGCRRTPSEDYSSLHSSEISNVPASASNTIYHVDITEAAPKYTNIQHMDNMSTEEKEDVYESKSTSFIADLSRPNDA
ncbi:uncharacterized protein LOC125677662 isoform X2 [Ostrea edulis]|uniref:uncharacterized protein LOC125677662 isoform X2 n=1 Tax=Ostrea edulis TaxID=37623 RepID=UPI0024AEAD1A|nr:uncharacterized protein LOC125677662 isoform X2 [Ostrea edulis]